MARASLMPRNISRDTGSVELLLVFVCCNASVSVSAEPSEQILIPEYPATHNTFVCAIYPSFNFAKHFTAGRAKNEMANTEKHEATILPVQVLGTVSPYPIVVTVICKVIKIVTLNCHL